MKSKLKTPTSKSVERRSDHNIPVDDGNPLLEPDPEILLPQTQAFDIEELKKMSAAFVRYDVYGTLGRGKLPWPEKILLAVGLAFLVPTRVAMGMSILVLYYVICRLCTAFFYPNREDDREDYAQIRGWQREVIVRSGRFLSRLLLLVFGFYSIRETSLSKDVVGQLNNEPASMDQYEELERPGAIVSNHISYIDILYHMSSSFPSFVAKRSVAELPLVGLISKCLGCVYVHRGLKSSDFKGVSGIVNERILEAHQDKSAPHMMLFPGYVFNGRLIAQVVWFFPRFCAVCSNYSIFHPFIIYIIAFFQMDIKSVIILFLCFFCFFASFGLSAEGTTTNGDYLLKFKTGAFLAKTQVLPVILRYPYQRFSAAWDSISGMRHLILLLCQFVNYIEVTKLPVYHPSEQERKDPKLYAEHVRQLMALKGNLILSDVGLAEKRVYLTALDGNLSMRNVLQQKDD
ncbi:lysophospholipid acyltransferase LPEAT1-like isoform X1 [Primulina huaijiensis]|uniref:lysophospholipid acyltransferase LPEAT1-like isoform X1 n=1 Tax=Primulina huaijiensis TaxID=1492673 RepID=UPI003CC73C9C